MVLTLLSMPPLTTWLSFAVTSRTVVVELTNGQWFAFDPRKFAGLQDAPPAILARVEVGRSGEELYWRSLGERLDVLNLLVSVVGRARTTSKVRNDEVRS